MNKEEYDLFFENDKLKREIEHLENEIRNLKQQNQMITELASHYKHLYNEVKKQKSDVVEYIKKHFQDDEGIIYKVEKVDEILDKMNELEGDK